MGRGGEGERGGANLNLASPTLIGTDLLEIARVDEMHQRFGEAVLQRVLTPSERKQFAQKGSRFYLASRIAGKEAVYKAISPLIDEGMRWQWIEILRDELGRPHVKLHGSWEALEARHRVSLSITHTHTLVQASAICFPLR